MERFQNKYRIQSHRMPRWDYSDNGIYFVTIVTQNRVCNLGNIHNGKMILSDFGEIVNNIWLKSFEIRQELFCDEYIIMPNHLHAIITLYNPENNALHDENGCCDGNDIQDDNNGFVGNGTNVGDGTNVEAHGRVPLQNQNQNTNQNQIQSPSQNSPSLPQSLLPQPLQSQNKITLIRKPKSISSFIAGFKSAVNSKIDDYIDEHRLNIPKYNRNNHFFQPNYHDHIIRNEIEYHRIKEYIVNNPSKWDEDKFYK